MNDVESRIGVSRDRVAERAYELYCQGGCEDGHDLDHWLQAEAELAQAVTGRNEPEAAETGAST